MTTKGAVLIEDNLGKPLAHPSSKIGLSYDDMLNEDFFFNMDSHDVMVFLHMQKTGKCIVSIVVFINNYYFTTFSK